MAIKIGKILFYCLSFTIPFFLVGCNFEAVQSECPPCYEVCKEYDCMELGCVSTEDANIIVNISNMLLEEYNQNTPGEKLLPLEYFPNLREG